MSRAPRWLSRLVVVGAGSAAIAAGVVPLTSTAAFAGTGDNATTITLSPSTVSDTVGNCTPYKVTTNANATFDVQISETTTQVATNTINFCSVANYTQFQGATDFKSTGTNNATFTCPASTVGGSPATQQTAQCDRQFTANASGIVEFGVTSDSPGPMKVIAYDDANQNDQWSQGENPNSQATETWVANVAASITCQPASQTQVITNTANWTCTAKTSAGTGTNDGAAYNAAGPATPPGPPGQFVYYTIQPNGPDTPAIPTDVNCPQDKSGTTGSKAGVNGVYDCSLTNTGGIGTDKMIDFVDVNNNGNDDPGSEPNTTNQVTWVNPAPNNSVVLLDCSPREEIADVATGSSATFGGSYCNEPPSQGDVTLTANVTAGSTPQSGQVVSFFSDGQDTNAALSDNGQCVTNAQGTCSIHAVSTDQADGFTDYWYAEVTTAASFIDSHDSQIDWNTINENDARNITVSPASASAVQGSQSTLTATVTDRHDDPVPGVCVGWSETGAGAFRNPTTFGCVSTNAGVPDNAYDTTCATNAQGQCSVEVDSNDNESGVEDITATIDTANNDNTEAANANQECKAPANRTYAYNDFSTNIPPGAESDNTPAGNCSSAAKVTWTTHPTTTHRVIVNLHLSCFSPKKHVVKCVGQLNRPISGVTVVFRNAAGTVVGRDVTNAAGKAVIKIRGLKSHRTHRYHAHAKKSAKTFGADSNVAKVRVS